MSSLRGALCPGLSEAEKEWFFADPEKGSLYKKALKICRDCPVKAPCLKLALENDEVGVWGATTKRQRDRMAKGSTNEMPAA